MRSSAVVVLIVTVLARLSGDVAQAAGQTHPLTVTGRALDPQGRPIEGATIFIASTDETNRLLGKATTDANGRYVFTDVPLPIPVNLSFDIKDNGYFQVFGRVRRRAWGWCQPRQLCLDRTRTIDRKVYPWVYFPDEKIELDLVFEESYPVSGRVVDERGQPVSGVKVTLSSCFRIDAKRSQPRDFREFQWLERHAAKLVPEDFVAATDATGRFQINSIPAGKVCWLSIEHSDYADTGIRPVVTCLNPPVIDGMNGQFRPSAPPLDVKLHSTRKVRVRISWSDTDAPAGGLECFASEVGQTPRHGARGVTGADGELLLRLVLGRYRLHADPPRDSKYVPTEREIRVAEQPAEQAVAFQVELGSVVLLKASDAESGKGIPDVGFWRREADSPVGERRDIAPWKFRHRTNREGEVRAVVPPGKQRIGLGLDLRPDYRAADPEESTGGRLLELPAGETVTVEFKLALEPEDDAQQPVAISGTVRFEGAIPAPKFIARPSKFRDGGMARPPIPDESLLVNEETGGVANVVISLDKPPAGVAVPSRPKKRVEIAIAEGRFVPHISVIRAGQPVVVANDDPEVTNVHVQTLVNPGTNQVVPPGDTLVWMYKRHEKIPLVMKSDLHRWLSGYLLVTDHPWVAVTDKTGAFAIRGLPAGKYAFKVWHEKAGYLDRSLGVEVKPGEVTQLKLAYPAEQFKK